MANMIGGQIFLDIEVHQALALVTEPTIIEIFVKREKRWLSQFVQQWDYLIIVHPPSPDFFSN